MTHDQAASPQRPLAPESGAAAPLHQLPQMPADAPKSSRRAFFGMLARVAGVAVLLPAVSRRATASPSAAVTPLATAVAGTVVVYKDASCGCCNDWVKHMQKAGFTVSAKNSANMDAEKKRLGVPASLASCHTAVVDDYLIEGHVPADLVQRLLREKPAARGLAVPGMPMGSPGMEGPTKDKYDVMLFDRMGKAKVYASR